MLQVGQILSHLERFTRLFAPGGAQKVPPGAVWGGLMLSEAEKYLPSLYRCVMSGFPGKFRAYSDHVVLETRDGTGSETIDLECSYK